MQSNSLNKKEINFLQNLSKELNTQDNRCTSYPIWRVLKIKKYIGFRERYSDGVCIFNEETEEMYEDRASLVECILENAVDIDGMRYNDIEMFLKDRGYVDEYVTDKQLINIIDSELGVGYLKKEFYKEIHELEGCFLTKAGIMEYMDSNRHKYTEDVYIYVDSAWDNKEMRQLIDILKNRVS